LGELGFKLFPETEKKQLIVKFLGLSQITARGAEIFLNRWSQVTRPAELNVVHIGSSLSGLEHGWSDNDISQGKKRKREQTGGTGGTQKGKKIRTHMKCGEKNCPGTSLRQYSSTVRISATIATQENVKAETVNIQSSPARRGGKNITRNSNIRKVYPLQFSMVKSPLHNSSCSKNYSNYTLFN
jgi:hypothetical protein